jgi:hypothetical protein
MGEKEALYDRQQMHEGNIIALFSVASKNTQTPTW